MTTEDNQSVRQTVSKEKLKALIYGLEEDQSVFFRRPCDYYGWGVTKKTILFESFFFLANYGDGTVDAQNLSDDYEETDDHFDIIWCRLLSEWDDETLSIRIITEEEAEEINAEADPFWDKLKQDGFTMSQVVEIIQRLGENGGGKVEITETKKKEPSTIWVEFTEWHETPICLIGGNGCDVSVLHPRDIPGVLDRALGSYLDGDIFLVK